MFEKEAEEYATRDVFFDGVPKPVINHQRKEDWQKGAEFGYNKANEWHYVKDGYPEINKLVRVRTFSGMEYVCTTEWYYPTEDEIGYGHALFSFYTLNDDWIDENEIKAWCELQPVPKESE